MLDIYCPQCGRYRATYEELQNAVRPSEAAAGSVRPVGVRNVCPCPRCGGSGFEGSNTGYGAVCSYCCGVCEMPVTRPFPNRPCAVSVHGDQSECLHPGCGASWDTNFEPNNEPPNCPNRPEVPMREPPPVRNTATDQALRDRMRRDAGAGTQRSPARGPLPDVMWQTTPDPRTRPRTRPRGRHADMTIIDDPVVHVDPQNLVAPIANEYIRRIAEEFQIPERMLRGLLGDVEGYMPDAIHPTPEAHDRHARTIRRVFEENGHSVVGPINTRTVIEPILDANKPNQFICRLRGPGIFGEDGWRVFRSLQPGQQLWLKREPTNPADPLAVMVQTLEGNPCGYVAREVAANIAADLDRNMLSWQCIMSASLPFLQLDRKT